MINQSPTDSLYLPLLGLSVNALSKHDLIALASEAVQDGRRCVVGNYNLHAVYLSQRDEKMQEFYTQADFVHIDGMPLIFAGWLSGLPLARKHRTGYVDLLPVLMARASAEGWRIFYLGSKPGVAAKGAAILAKQYPNVEIRTRDGYFDPANQSENGAVIDDIREFSPHILLVGMGMPRQEAWILDNLDRIQSNAIFCCGALIDYIAGETRTPPRWLGQIGLEGVYRLFSEPRRLWRRYLVEPILIAQFLVAKFVRRRSEQPVSGIEAVHEIQTQPPAQASVEIDEAQTSDADKSLVA
jgi:N-acetylglucosaminyldiphosphoundecaprenol N-acetyl-beta-D-mannosaminyltransferase